MKLYVATATVQKNSHNSNRGGDTRGTVKLGPATRAQGGGTPVPTKLRPCPASSKDGDVVVRFVVVVVCGSLLQQPKPALHHQHPRCCTPRLFPPPSQTPQAWLHPCAASADNDFRRRPAPTTCRIADALLCAATESTVTRLCSRALDRQLRPILL